MRLIGLFLLYCPPDASFSSSSCTMLAYATDVSKFPFLQQGAAREASKFLARTVAQRVSCQSREVVEHEGSVAIAFRRADGLAGVAVADEEYPPRVAFKLLAEAMDAFAEQFQPEVWRAGSQENAFKTSFKPKLNAILKAYKDPVGFDALAATQSKVEAAHAEMHKSIDALLRAGESLEALVVKSEDLSTSSKVLFKQAKHAKSHYACCKVQ
eukprot:GHVT01102792.1.p2 GENE.GHVT01102792.1~~GHVT01102792.1.p2  ORF type:complete len:212 (+),score=60.89 GHVT01102792.1:879-1514(+)